MPVRLAVGALLSIGLVFAQRLSELNTPCPLPEGSTLIVGFLGGLESWNNEHRSVRKVALHFRNRRGVYAETFENRRRSAALHFIRNALSGAPDPRLILYGQSLGAAAAIATARDLDRLGIRVLLTVQVDSVGRHDDLIPPNVAEAVNFFQHDPLTIRGRQEIRAWDRERTHILGNFEMSYPIMMPVHSRDASWARRTLGGSHAKMELDPRVWARVEEYIEHAISK